MDPLKIVNELISILTSAYEVLMKTGEACLIFIGLYTFYRTFLSKKLRFIGFRFSFRIWEGYSFDATIQNWSLSALSINKIELVVDNEYAVTLKKFDDPFLLEPLKAVRIESERMAESPFFDTNICDKKLKLLISCSDGRILHAKYKIHKRCAHRSPEYKRKTIINHFYDGVLITADMKYAVCVISPDGKQTHTFLNKYGLIKDPIRGCNAISRENVDKKDEVVNILKDLLGPGYKVILDDLTLPSTNESVIEG